MAKQRATDKPAKANSRKRSRPQTTTGSARKTSTPAHHSAMSREPVETAGAPMDWKRITFAGAGAAVLTVLIVYVVFHIFGLAAGASGGDVAAGASAIDAAQGVSGWTTLVLAVIFTFLAALWSVRATVEKHLLQGFLVGLIAAVLVVGPLIGFMGGTLDGLAIATFLLTLGAGTVAGFFGSSSGVRH